MPQVGVTAQERKGNLRMKFDGDIEAKMREGVISYGAALILRFFAKNERPLLYDIFEKLKPSTNKMREISEYIFEISKRDGIRPADIFRMEEVRKMLASEESRKTKISRLRAFLRGIRFPLLSKKEKEINEMIKNLKLPAGARLKLPENFEGDKITLEILFTGEKPFRKSLEEISEKIDGINEIKKFLQNLSH